MIETSQPSKLFFIFSILSALFTLSMFYRVSSAVIAPNLMHDLGLNAENLGILGGAFFYSFALLQIPMGPMLDRMGPRIVITSFSMIGALGAFVFACGNSFLVVLLGRILIGAGMASALMGSMKVFLLRFSPGKFVTLIGLFQAVGTFGNIFAASPLAFLASTVGWRMTFVIAGVVTALLALFNLPDFRRRKGRQRRPCFYSLISTGDRDFTIFPIDSWVPHLLADRSRRLLQVRNLCKPSGFVVGALSHRYQGIFSRSNRQSHHPPGHWNHCGWPHSGVAL